MKKVLITLALLLAFVSSGYGQGTGPITVKEADGSPSYTGIRTFIFDNGTVTISGNTARVLNTGGGGSGTVTTFSCVTANGVSCSVANATTTPAATFTLGAITPTSVNGLTISTVTGGTFTLTNSKTFTVSNTLTLAGTDGSTLNIGAGGTLGTAAFTAASAYEVPLTFSTGLTRTTDTITVNAIQNITRLSNLTSNGFVKTSGGNGTLSVDTATYITGLTVGTTTIGSGNSGRFLYDNAGVVAETGTGFTISGTVVTASAGVFRVTNPWITTSLLDSSGNFVLGITPTASATQYLSVNNDVAAGTVGLTANVPAVATTTIAGTNVAITASAATVASTTPGAAAGGSVTITGGAAARLSSGNANGGNVNIVGGEGTGTGTPGQLLVSLSGANASSSMTTTSATISNTRTGTTNTNVALTLTASGATTANTALNVTAGGIVQTSNLASAFTSGPSGATNPVFQLDNSVSSAATGLKITGNAAGSGVTATVLSPNAAESLTINAKGSTGAVILGAGAAGFTFTVNGSTGFKSIDASTTISLEFKSDATGLYMAQGQYKLSTDVGWARTAAAVWRATNGSTAAGSLILGPSTASIGTSGVGVLAIGGSTAPTTSPAAQVQAYSVAAGTNDNQLYVRTEAGEVNRLSGLTAKVGTQFDATSTTALANVTNLTRNVEAGRTYAFTVVLYTTSNVAGGVKAAIAGTATATSIVYEAEVKDGSTLASMGTARATALATTVGDVTAVTAARITITGTIVVNAAGTLTVQFAQNASNGTASSVLVNSSFQLIPIS